MSPAACLRSNSMYLEHFDLSTYPFADVPDPLWYVPHKVAESAYADMVYSIMRDDAVVVLEGETGSGKTLLLQRLVQDLDDSNDVHFVSFSALSFEQVLAYIVDGFDASSDGGELVANVRAIKAYLDEVHAQGKRSLLLIDDAHMLDEYTLNQLILLTNYVIQGDRPLTLVLAGEFSAVGGVPAGAQARTRFQSCLGRLNEDDIALYIQSRWRIAGGQNDLAYDANGIRAAYEHCHGNVRRFGQIVDAALSVAAATQSQSISADIVVRALARFGGEAVLSSLAPLPAKTQVSAGVPLLEVIDGSGQRSAEIALESGVYSIGRAEDCDVQLASSHVSRYHARIEMDSGAATLVDLGSVNRAIVNGVPVSSHALVNGDEIQLGEYTLRFVNAA